MKLTFHNGRKDRSGLHNDRNFDISYAAHIIPERVKDDQYWTYTGTKDKSLRDIEMDYYEEHFGKYIEAQNKRNESIGHKERNKTLSQFYKGAYTRPEDKIIQIGNKDDHVDAQVLWECALEYQKRFDELYGEHCKILTMALHVDEATPHVHVRRVWTHKDENGYEKVGQTKALEKLGILTKEPDRPEGRCNNSKITFTAQDRELFRQICIEKSIELEPDQPSKRPHLTDKGYKEAVAEIEELERTRDDLRAEVNTLKTNALEVKELLEVCEDFLQQEQFNNMYREEVENAQKKKDAEKLKIYLELLQKEVVKAAETGNFKDSLSQAVSEEQIEKLQKQNKTLEHKIDIYNHFIWDNELKQKFLEYINVPEKTYPDVSKDR